MSQIQLESGKCIKWDIRNLYQERKQNKFGNEMKKMYFKVMT